MLISHPAEGIFPDKSLREHLFTVGSLSYDQVMAMRLNLTVLSQKKLAGLSRIIGYLHDFGKATTYFQSHVRGVKVNKKLSQHSFLSAVFAYYFVRSEFDEKIWAIIAYQIIKKHHGNLESIVENISVNLCIAKEQIDNITNNTRDELVSIYTDLGINIGDLFDSIDFEEEVEEFQDEIDEYADSSDQKIELFFIENLLYSLLIDNDKKDAARLDLSYFTGNLHEPLFNLKAYLEMCKRKEPDKFDPLKEINRQRNDFLEEITSNTSISKDNHFYTITAPTGIGKTFGCLAFAESLKKELLDGEGRIIYCLPYTSIIDQNYDEFRKVILFSLEKEYKIQPQRYLLKHHYLTSKKIENRIDKEDYSYKAYRDDVLFVESWESAMIVTTFVQFFHTVIGYKNSFLKKFHNVVNSIVILDEVQNIDPHYYRLLQDVFDILGKRFNIYFLLITATQPKILDSVKSKPIPIVCSEKYMTHSLFNRVRLTVCLEEKSLSDFSVEFIKDFNQENCLVVLNTKKAATEFYKKVEEKFTEYKCYCLTGNLIPKDRRNKIEAIKATLKNKRKIIVISTQLIEAGVDLSFKMVYRDFGPLDSIIQVAGRCNRNGEYGEVGGEMVLLRLKDDNDREFNKWIYEAKVLHDVKQVLSSDSYESRDFFSLSTKYYDLFDFTRKSTFLLQAIRRLNYDKLIRDEIPVSEFKLIEEYPSDSVFFLIDMESQKWMEEFIIKKNRLIEVENKNERDELFLKIEKLKGKLRDYQLSLRTSELIEYRNTNLLHEEDFYSYFPYDKVQIAYNNETGFSKTPSEYCKTECL